MTEILITELGDGGVGKTFYVNGVIAGINKTVINPTKPTKGFDEYYIEMHDCFSEEGNISITPPGMNEQLVEVKVIDYGAQRLDAKDEQQLRNYLKLSRMVIVVVDLTEEKTLDRVVDYYYPMLEECFRPLSKGIGEKLIALYGSKMYGDKAKLPFIDNQAIFKKERDLSSLGGFLEVADYIDAMVASIGDSLIGEEHIIKGPEGLLDRFIKVARLGCAIPIMYSAERIRSGNEEWIPHYFRQTLNTNGLTIST